MGLTIIIGGTRGIGLEIYNSFIKEKNNVISISRRKLNRKNHINFDLLENQIDILINNKLLSNKRIDNLIFSQRYRGKNEKNEYELTILKVQEIIELFQKKFNTNASIVLIGSIAKNYIVNEQNSSYHITRGALDSLVKYYAVKLGPKKIRVNAVIPDVIIKKENLNYFNKTNKKRKLIEKITPLGRMGTSKDISNAVGFLCQKESNFITGQTIIVDGGLSIRGHASLSDLINNHKG
tara:strand:+ start:2302 stop:3012 length:711 start_codon:yes stop_codon:yes gene_type:complete